MAALQLYNMGHVLGGSSHSKSWPLSTSPGAPEKAGGIFDLLGIYPLKPQRAFYMEFCLSFPTPDHVVVLYLGHIGLCLKSPGVQELWTCGDLEPASYKFGEAVWMGWWECGLIPWGCADITLPGAIGITKSPPSK